MKIDLNGRRAVIAGGSRGLGLATALAFARAGADVSICARGAASLREAETLLRETGADVHAQVCDLSDAGSIEAYVAAAAGALGGIDILVNNATGKGSGNTEEDWLKSLSVDVMGTVRTIRAARPHLEASSAGCVINVASRNAVRPSPRTQAYGAAKSAIIQLTSSLAVDMGRKLVRVNCIAPGSTDFPGGWWDQVRTENPAYYERTLAMFPFGRFGRADDIANVMLFLASPLAGWITGQTLLVDGGQTLGA